MTTDHSIRSQAKEMDRYLRKRFASEQVGSTTSTIVITSSYIEVELRQREKATWAEAMIEVAAAKIELHKTEFKNNDSAMDYLLDALGKRHAALNQEEGNA